MLKEKPHNLLQKGTVIPAHALALNAEGEQDNEREKWLTHYCTASGTGAQACLGASARDLLDQPFLQITGISLSIRRAGKFFELFSTGKHTIRVNTIFS